MADALSSRHATVVLLYLLEKGQIKKTDLLDVISSSDSLSKSLRDMEAENLIKISVKIIGRKVIFIELTPKGRQVAEQLKKAQEIAEKPSVEIEESSPKIGITEEAASHVQELRLLYHTNVLDDHVTISEIPRNGGRTRRRYSGC